MLHAVFLVGLVVITFYIRTCTGHNLRVRSSLIIGHAKTLNFQNTVVLLLAHEQFVSC